MDYRQAELNALAAEALRRGTSYGKLVAATTEGERREITRRWIEKKRRGVASSKDGPKRGRGEGQKAPDTKSEAEGSRASGAGEA